MLGLGLLPGEPPIGSFLMRVWHQFPCAWDAAVPRRRAVENKPPVGGGRTACYLPVSREAAPTRLTDRLTVLSERSTQIPPRCCGYELAQIASTSAQMLAFVSSLHRPPY